MVNIERERVRVTRGKIVSLATLKIIIGRITSYLNLAQFFMVYLLLAIPYIQGAALKIVGAVVIGVIMLIIGWWDFNHLFGVENEVTAVQNPFIVKYYTLFHKIEENQNKMLERLEKIERKLGRV